MNQPPGERVQPSERPADYPAISWQVSRGNFLPSILNELAPYISHTASLVAQVNEERVDWCSTGQLCLADYSGTDLEAEADEASQGGDMECS